MFELLCCSYNDQDRIMHINIVSCFETDEGRLTCGAWSTSSNNTLLCPPTFPSLSIKFNWHANTSHNTHAFYWRDGCTRQEECMHGSLSAHKRFPTERLWEVERCWARDDCGSPTDRHAGTRASPLEACMTKTQHSTAQVPPPPLYKVGSCWRTLRTRYWSGNLWLSQAQPNARLEGLLLHQKASSLLQDCHESPQAIRCHICTVYCRSSM